MTDPDPNLPQPDPTARATEIVDKGLAALKELLVAQLQAEHDLCQEKFRGIDQRFSDVDARTREQKEDTKVALTDALTAAGNAITLQTTASEKAIDKSEQATAKELAQLSATFGAAIARLTDSSADLKDQERLDVGELKDRVGRIESVKVGGVEARTAIYGLTGFIIAIVTIASFLAATGAFGK